MQLHSVTGDIVVLAPDLCEMTVLWLRDGFNRRSQTWRDIRERYPTMRPLSRLRYADQPWRNSEGATFELPAADNLLRYIHVLPNPASAHGCLDLLAVGTVVGSAMDVADSLGVQKIGFIHIPAFRGGERQVEDAESACAMIGALGGWDASHPGAQRDVYLIDLRGHFDPFITQAPPPPPKPEPEPPT